MNQKYIAKHETNQYKTRARARESSIPNSPRLLAARMERIFWNVLLFSLLITTMPAQADENDGVGNTRTNKTALSVALEHASKVAKNADVAQETASRLADYPLRRVDPRPLSLLIDEVTGIATAAALDVETRVSIGTTSKAPLLKGEPSARRQP